MVFAGGEQGARRRTGRCNDLLSSNLDDRCVRVGLGRCQSLLTHAGQMQLDCLAHALLYCRLRRTGGNASRQIGRIRRESRWCLLHNDEDLHCLSPACLRMLFNVPGARSSPACPATVTSPGLTGCLNCWWLPRVRTRYHPSSVSRRRRSRTFIDRRSHHRPNSFKVPLESSERPWALFVAVPRATRLAASIIKALGLHERCADIAPSKLIPWGTFSFR